jgi:hypothetical protein
LRGSGSKKFQISDLKFQIENRNRWGVFEFVRIELGGRYVGGRSKPRPYDRRAITLVGHGEVDLREKRLAVLRGSGQAGVTN